MKFGRFGREDSALVIITINGGLTVKIQRVIRRESKTDSYSKDLLFLACIAFFVITYYDLDLFSTSK